jgi:hypothetical protein
MFAAAAVSFAGRGGIAIGAIATTIAICTAFGPSDATQIVIFSATGIATALAAIFVCWLESDQLHLRWPLLRIAGVVLAVLFAIVRWRSYLGEYEDVRSAYWFIVYPSHGALWSFVDDNIPTDATIAYSNQFMIYPMFGFDCQRRLIYAPVRAGASIANLVFPDRVPDDEFFTRSMDAANSPADPAAWVQNLRASEAQYLVVGVGKKAPEIGWADADSSHFKRIFANDEAVVYRIDWL